jgi:hypothetical protein
MIPLLVCTPVYLPAWKKLYLAVVVLFGACYPFPATEKEFYSILAVRLLEGAGFSTFLYIERAFHNSESSQR